MDRDDSKYDAEPNPIFDADSKYDAEPKPVYNAISLPNPNFNILREGGHLCDVSVRSRDASNEIVDFLAHKVVLVASSPFFYHLYSDGQLGNDVVELPAHFRPATFAVLLDAMYGKPITLDALYALRIGSCNEAVQLKHLKDLASFLELRDMAKRLELWLEDSQSIYPDSNVKHELAPAEEKEPIKEENDDDYSEMPNALSGEGDAELARNTSIDCEKPYASQCVGDAELARNISIDCEKPYASPGEGDAELARKISIDSEKPYASPGEGDGELARNISIDSEKPYASQCEGDAELARKISIDSEKLYASPGEGDAELARDISVDLTPHENTVKKEKSMEIQAAPSKLGSHVISAVRPRKENMRNRQGKGSSTLTTPSWGKESHERTSSKESEPDFLVESPIKKEGEKNVETPAKAHSNAATGTAKDMDLLIQDGTNGKAKFGLRHSVARKQSYVGGTLLGTQSDRLIKKQNTDANNDANIEGASMDDASIDDTSHDLFKRQNTDVNHDASNDEARTIPVDRPKRKNSKVWPLSIINDDDANNDDANNDKESAIPIPTERPKRKCRQVQPLSMIDDDNDDDDDCYSPPAKSRVIKRSSRRQSSGEPREAASPPPEKMENNSCDPDDPIIRSQFTQLTHVEIQKMFPNPRDRVMVGKMRVKNRIDPAIVSITSYHHAKDSPISMIGKSIPYGNRSARVDKIGNHVKTITGEIRGGDVKRELELKLSDGDVTSGILCKFTSRFLTCPFCDLKIRVGPTNSTPFTSCRLATHFLTDHDYLWLDFALVCDLCDFVSFKVEHAQDHLVHFHGGRKENNSDDFSCAECGKTFASKKGLIIHNKRYGCVNGSETKSQKAYPRQTHMCGSCGKVWTSAIALENHLSKEHGAPYRLSCDQDDCSYGTNGRYEFINHLFSVHKINTGGCQIFKCSRCDFVTMRKQVFQKHELSHTAVEYLFKCTHEGCNKAFKQRRHLVSHIVCCHKDEKLPCPHCRNTFGSAKKLREHVKFMHTHRFRNFKCSYCDHATVMRGNCATHVKRRHPGRPVIVVDLAKSGLTPLPV